MSRSVSVSLCAIMAFVALCGVPWWVPAPVLAADATVNIEAPLHESPDPGAPLVALLPVGTMVTIEGPPVEGFYPVSVDGVTGWLVGETLSVAKEMAADGAVAESTPDDASEPVLAEQLVVDEPAPAAAPVPTDTTDAADPAVPTDAAVPVDAPGSDTPNSDALVAEPAPDLAKTDALTTELSPETGTALAAGAEPADDAAVSAAAVPTETATPVAADGTAPPADAATALTPRPDAAELSSKDAAPATEPAPQPELTPEPTAEPAPYGPATATINMPIFGGPGPDFGLIFTVPQGSTVEQTGQLEHGYVSVRYKEVAGWSAREQLGEPIAPVEETVDATAEPVDTKTPKPGSGVAYATIDLSMRAGPSASEEPVAVVPAGSRVVLTGVMESGFQRVNFREQIGWVANEYLATPADPEPEADRDGRDGQQYSEQQIVRIIYDAADRYDQSRSAMLRVARCESNLDTYAVNPSGSYGLFQFIRSTWRSTPYGNEDIFDPRANANAAAWMWSEGRKSEWVCQ